MLISSHSVIASLMLSDFLPNNDIAPSRRFRIQKALDWGAVWVKDWRPGVTHIIVDRELKYKDVLSFLKLSAIPVSVGNNSKLMIANVHSLTLLWLMKDTLQNACHFVIS